MPSTVVARGLVSEGFVAQVGLQVVQRRVLHVVGLNRGAQLDGPMLTGTPGRGW